MRIPIIAGNWKMNKNAEEAALFIEEVKNKLPATEQVESVIVSPDLFIQNLLSAAKGSPLKIGAQNTFYEPFGAYTGETSPVALSKLGVAYVVLGHSERRQFFHETNEDVNKKVHAVLAQDMKPIVCVGESLEEKDAGQTADIVKAQVVTALKDVAESEIEKVVFAYEPIWAIGSGQTATSELANETAMLIRQVLTDLYSEETANKVRIQYGGSVKPENIHEFLAQSDIDGALVGGASLDPESFIALLEGVKND